VSLVNAPSLREVFDPKLNAFNALRLLMALLVVVWHSFPLTATPVTFEPLRQIFSRLPVDVFFTVSGFLIVSSWVRNPRVVAFVRARVLRIFPAFWVCLIVTALAFAPLSVAIRGTGLPAGYAQGAVGYVLKNAGLRVWQNGIAGTPAGIPYAGQWNGALWTLGWEFSCYVAVLVIGLVGLFRYKTTIPALYLLCTLGVLVSAYGPVHNWYVTNGSRFGIMFAAGALVFRFQDRIPVSRMLMAVAAVLIAVSAFLPDYGVVAGLPIAYLAMTLGASVKRPRLTLSNDISYGIYIYGFPIQQVLSTLGAGRGGPGLFALAAIAVTVPVAAASWFVIERPALRLKGGRSAPRSAPAARAGVAAEPPGEPTKTVV
jgi:peptidoglycan/LPS O-acetylase OafA/YrhL